MKKSETSPTWNELCALVWQGDFTGAEYLLQERPHLMTLRNGIGETVLHYLAVEDDLRGVSWLRSRGFDLNVKNEFGTPVVFEVAQLGYKELLLWFIREGADMSATDSDSHDIRTYLLEYDQHEMASFLNEHIA